MNADKRRCLSAADSSAFIRVRPRSVKAVFPGKNPGKLLAGYLSHLCHSGIQRIRCRCQSNIISLITGDQYAGNHQVNG